MGITACTTAVTVAAKEELLNSVSEFVKLVFTAHLDNVALGGSAETNILIVVVVTSLPKPTVTRFTLEVGLDTKDPSM